MALITHYRGVCTCWVPQTLSHCGARLDTIPSFPVSQRFSGQSFLLIRGLPKRCDFSQSFTKIYHPPKCSAHLMLKLWATSELVGHVMCNRSWYDCFTWKFSVSCSRLCATANQCWLSGKEEGKAVHLFSTERWCHSAQRQLFSRERELAVRHLPAQPCCGLLWLCRSSPPGCLSIQFGN